MLKIIPSNNEIFSPQDTLGDLARITETIALIFMDDRNPPELGAETTMGVYSLLDAVAGGIRDAIERLEEQREELVTIPEMNVYKGKKQKFSIPQTN